MSKHNMPNNNRAFDMPKNNFTTENSVREDGAKNDSPKAEEIVTGVVTGCDSLRVRKAPSVSADIVTTIPKGTKVAYNADEQTGDFVYVKTSDGVSGFCMIDFID